MGCHVNLQSQTEIIDTARTITFTDNLRSGARTMAEKELTQSGADGDVWPRRTLGKAEGSPEDVEATIRREEKRGLYKNVAHKDQNEGGGLEDTAEDRGKASVERTPGKAEGS
jgi:hypothetical protein